MPSRPVHALVTGGCGYIGSHMVRLLTQLGHQVTVLDNLSTGHRQACGGARLAVADIRDAEAVQRIFAANAFDVVMHFAGLIVVSESVVMPGVYYDVNVTGTLVLLEAMRKAGVNRFVFSSTAAVYGEPEGGGLSRPLREDDPTRPINPYGHGKRMVEQMLADYRTAHGLSSVVFRYFNAAGADPSGEIGEAHNPETHLIPNVLNAALAGQDGGQGLTVFGDDYPTPDGTCLRDYIHINDLARAHLAAVAYMEQHEGAHLFNLGNGRGFSVLEVIEAARRVTGKDIGYRVAPRRAGDAPALVADGGKAREALGWTPDYPEVDGIIETAWRWARARRY
ncbi:UDP-glucose 4-epimerase GalE [Megalodesulfovibrio paquesii]